MRQGFLKAQYRIALELLRQGDYLIEKAAQVTGLSERELQALVDAEG